MKMLIIGLSFFLFLCAGCVRQRGPILYDNIVVSVRADNVLLLEKPSEGDFAEALSDRLSKFVKTEIKGQGQLGVVSVCGPRTMKVDIDVSAVTTNTIVAVRAESFLFLPTGGATSTSSDDVYIDSTITYADCESESILETLEDQSVGKSPVGALHGTAYNAAWYAYFHQRAKLK